MNDERVHYRGAGAIYCQDFSEGDKISFALSVDSVTCKNCLDNIYDPVNKPKHYNAHPSGIECIQITEHMSFTLGNAMKYIWRADLKNGVEDLEKAVWYLNREIEKRKNGNNKT